MSNNPLVVMGTKKTLPLEFRIPTVSTAMDEECNSQEPEDSEAKFRKTLRQIITLSPKVKCPHEQKVLHEWVDRLLEPPCTDEDEERRLEYSRYLQFQLKRGKLHMPFLETPCQGTLKPLDQMLGQRQDEDKKEEGRDSRAGSRESVDGGRRKSSRKKSLIAERRMSKHQSSMAKIPCKGDALEMAKKRLLQLLKCIDIDNVTLESFIVAVGPHTLDKGKLMTEVCTSEQIQYHQVIENLYKDKEKKISQELAREQAGIPERYRIAKQRMLSRAMAGINYIKSKCPGFQYERWQENPDYLRDIFKLKERKTATADSMSEWERKTLQTLHDINYEAERLEEANTDKEKEIQELMAQQNALEQDYNCKKAALAKKITDLESEKFGFVIANDERDRMIEHLLATLQNQAAELAATGDKSCAPPSKKK